MAGPSHNQMRLLKPVPNDAAGWLPDCCLMISLASSNLFLCRSLRLAARLFLVSASAAFEGGVTRFAGPVACAGNKDLLNIHLPQAYRRRLLQVSH